MSYKLEIFSGAVWYDVSDSVVSISSVPIVSRNINYGLKADSFKCAIGASYNGSSIGSNVRLNATTYMRFGTGGVVYFLGKVHKKNLNYDASTYEYEILNAVTDLNDYFVDFDTLDTTIVGEAASGVGSSFTIDAGNDEVDDSGHGLSDGTPIVFTGSGSNDEIDKNVVYFIDNIAGNSFKLYGDQALTDGPLNLIDTTTTNMTYHTFTDQFEPYDNQTFSNMTVLHLIKALFIASGLDALAGADLEGSGAIASTTIVSSKSVFETGTSDTPANRSFNFGQIRIDKNMVYALNQDYAINSTKITSNDIEGYDTESKKITFWELLDNICSLFYFNIYYDDGFQIVRNTAEGTYSVSNDTSWDYDKTTIPARLQDSRWQIKGNNEDPTNIGIITELRAKYNTITASELVDAQSPPKDLVLYTEGGASEKPLKWIKSLMFLCEGQWAGAGTTDVYETLGDGEPSGGSHNFFRPADGTGGKDIGEAMEDEALQSYDRETFLTQADVTFRNVVLNEIDPAGETSKIIEVAF